MFDMDLPWWEFVVRGAAIYGVLLVMLRITGRRTVGQFTPFDLLVMMLLSESVSNAISGGDNSLVGGIIAAGALLGMDVIVGWLAVRSKSVDRLLQGDPILIGRDGIIYREVCKRYRTSIQDVEKALRAANCDLENMRCVFLEATGELTVMKRET